MSSTRAVIGLEGVHLAYNRGRADEVRALNGIDLTVSVGEFVTVVGSNGAGKSSLVHVIAGTARPTIRTVTLTGRNVSRWADHSRAGLIARVFDDPRVGTAPELSIEDNVALAMSRGHRRGLGRASNLTRRQTMRDRLATLGLGLEDRLHEPVGLLSAGQRQSLTLIMAALGAPALLLLDEHLAALDPVTARRVLDITSALVAEMSCATLMVTHHMDHALTLGERLLVMSQGLIVADIGGHAKRALRVNDVIDLITGAGDIVSDRIVLGDLTPA